MATVLITGGAGFIGSCFVRQWLGEEADQLVNLDKLTYAGNLDSLGPSPEIHGISSCKETSAIARSSANCSRSIGRGRSSISLPSRTSIARSTDRRNSCRPTFWALSSCSTRHAAIGTPCRSASRAEFRFLQVSTDEVYGSLGQHRTIHRVDAVLAQFALLGQQSGLRPFRACLPPHLRTAGADHELLEQLRAVSVSRKADSADDPQRHGRESPAGLWRWAANPRLAVRRGSLPRDPLRFGGSDSRAKRTTSAAIASGRT